MKHYRLLAMIFVLAPALILVSAKSKKNAPLAPIFGNAQYVYVEAEGTDMLRPGAYPSDRDVVAYVQQGLREWDRYELTNQRDRADLLFSVRKGRVRQTQRQEGVTLPSRQAGQGGQTPGRDPSQAGADNSASEESELGQEDDQLRVYTFTPEGKLKGPIWMGSLRNGLDGPSVPLLQQLREAVERAYPTKTPASSPTP
jgi:hypothetical protein